MNNRKEITSETQKQFEQKRKTTHAHTPDEQEVIATTLREKGPMPNKDHEEAEPSGLSSDGRM